MPQRAMKTMLRNGVENEVKEACKLHIFGGDVEHELVPMEPPISTIRKPKAVLTAPAGNSLRLVCSGSFVSLLLWPLGGAALVV